MITSIKEIQLIASQLADKIDAPQDSTRIFDSSLQNENPHLKIKGE